VRSRFLILAVTIELVRSVAPAPARAQGWVREMGHVYAKVYASTFRSNGVFDRDGSFVSDPDLVYSNVALGVYAETGIAPRTSLTVTGSFQWADNVLRGRERYRRTGPGDLGVQVAVQLAKPGSCALALALRAVVPVYGEGIQSDANVGTTGSSGAGRFVPALGDGSFDFVPTFSFGCALEAIHGWVGASLGHLVRTGGFGDGLAYFANVGSFVWPGRLALTAYVDGTQTLTRGDRMPTKSLFSFGVGSIVTVAGPVSLEVTFSYLPWAIFASRGWSLSGGVSVSI
jgi:hypothetical protein